MQLFHILVQCLELLYRVDDILNELRKGVNVETTDYIVFFKGLKNMEIDIGFNDVEDLTHFQAQLSDTWLDFMLIHIFATNITLNRSGYFLLTSQAFFCLRNDAKSSEGVARWGKKIFRNHKKSCNIMIALYLVRNHWSLYIVEEKRTIHFDSIPRHHDNTSTLQLQKMCEKHALFLRAKTR